MQIRSKAYLQIISLWRSFRDLIPPNDHASARASPCLIYAAVVLALLLAMLEADLHSDELRSLGLVRDSHAIESIFLSP
jgi:hypothetical protein